MIKLKRICKNLQWLGDHEFVKNYVGVIMLTHEEITIQIHRSLNFNSLTSDGVFTAFKIQDSSEYKETSEEMCVHCQLSEAGHAKIQKPSLALKCREKVVVESSEEKEDMIPISLLNICGDLILNRGDTNKNTLVLHILRKA